MMVEVSRDPVLPGEKEIAITVLLRSKELDAVKEGSLDLHLGPTRVS